jgi:hypothetical protein
MIRFTIATGLYLKRQRECVKSLREVLVWQL